MVPRAVAVAAADETEDTASVPLAETGPVAVADATPPEVTVMLMFTERAVGGAREIVRVPAACGH